MFRESACVFVLMLAAPVQADSCRFSAQREVRLPSEGVQRVNIHALRGELRVQGVAGARNVNANGRACAGKESLLDEVQLRARRDGSTLHIETVMPEVTMSLLGTRNESWLDLTVHVPVTVPIVVTDSSGVTDMRNVGPTTITDGSGDLRIDGVSGALVVKDGSGGLYIRDVRGKATVTDDSGELHIAGIAGTLLIPADGSGEIRVRDVTGDVRVVRDGSGALSIEQVRGDVRVDEDGSGAIDVRHVGGTFRVGRDGSGSVSHHDVGGATQVAGSLETVE